MALTVCNYIKSPGSGGKFIVLRPIEGDPADGVAVFSDFTRDFMHRDIVARWQEGRKTTLAAAGMRVAGGGWWKFENADSLVLYGQSAAYGRFDRDWIRPLLRPGAILTETRIDVR